MAEAFILAQLLTDTVKFIIFDIFIKSIPD